METLLDTLTQYAEENLVLRYLREYTPQLQKAQLREDKLTGKLTALSPEAAGYVEQLKIVLGDVYSCREQAFLLSGISIGLELGRLQLNL